MVFDYENGIALLSEDPDDFISLPNRLNDELDLFTWTVAFHQLVAGRLVTGPTTQTEKRMRNSGRIVVIDFS